MPSSVWSMGDAKRRLDELLTLAEHQPQIIVRRNRRFVVIDEEDYQRIAASVHSLRELVLNGPSLDSVDLVRDGSGARDVEL